MEDGSKDKKMQRVDKNVDIMELEWSWLWFLKLILYTNILFIGIKEDLVSLKIMNFLQIASNEVLNEVIPNTVVILEWWLFKFREESFLQASNHHNLIWTWTEIIMTNIQNFRNWPQQLEHCTFFWII